VPGEVALFPRPASAATLAALAADRYELALLRGEHGDSAGADSALRDVERLMIAASDAGEREDRLAAQLEERQYAEPRIAAACDRILSLARIGK